MRIRSNLLLASACVMITCGAGKVGHTATFNTTASADTFVATGATGNLSSNNFGGGGALALASGALPLGEFQSVLLFDLAAARNSFDTQFGAGAWTLQSVSLQLTASPHNNAIYNGIAAGQFNISWMQNDSWVEGTGTAGLPTADGISFNTLQGIYMNGSADQALGTFGFGGTSSGANSYTLAMTSGLVGDMLGGNSLSLRLFAADNVVSYLFSSRANGSVLNRPTLTITAVPEPTGLTMCAMGGALLWYWRSVTVRPVLRMKKNTETTARHGL